MLALPMKTSNNPYVQQIEEYQEWIISKNNLRIPQWEQEFSQQFPLLVDLGCGAGNFLRDVALQFPQYNYIGFELRYKRLVKGAIKFKKRSLKNIRLIQDRAESIGRYFQNNSIHTICVHFPDPWAKSHQKKHRLLTKEFVTTLHQLLLPQGYFRFKTDHQEYFNTVCSWLESTPQFLITEKTTHLYESPYSEENIPTEFELLFKNQQLPVHYCLAQKK